MLERTRWGYELSKVAQALGLPYYSSLGNPLDHLLRQYVKSMLDSAYPMPLSGYRYPCKHEIHTAIDQAPPSHLRLISSIQIHQSPMDAQIGAAVQRDSYERVIKLFPIPESEYQSRMDYHRSRPGFAQNFWGSVFLHELGHLVFHSLPQQLKSEWVEIWRSINHIHPSWKDPEEAFSDCYAGFIQGAWIPSQAYQFMRSSI